MTKPTQIAIFKLVSILLATCFLTSCLFTNHTTIGQNFYPGVNVSSQNSQVLVSATSVKIGQSLTVTVYLRDTNGNAFVSTLPTLTLQTSGGTSQGNFSSVQNNGDGSYTATFTGTVAGSAINILTIVNGAKLSSASSVTVISPVPTANSDTFYVQENGSAVDLNVLANDSDNGSGYSLNISSVNTTGTSGSVSNNGSNVSYTPASSFTGVDTFTYTISDGHGDYATATVTVNVMSSYTWTGATGDGQWSTAGNWCGSVNASNSACAGASSAPSTSDTVTFDGTCAGSNCNATIGANISVAGVDMNSGYSGKITQSSGDTITIGSSGFTQSSGTFVGGNSTFTVYGPFTLSGGSFTATSGTSNFGPTNSYSAGETVIDYTGGTFLNNNGSVVLAGMSVYAGATYTVLTDLTLTFYDLQITDHACSCGTASFAQSGTGTIVVSNTFTHSAGLLDMNVDVEGNISVSTTQGGTGTITLDGTSPQQYTGSASTLTANVVVNNSSGVGPAAGTTSFGVSSLTLDSGTFTAPSGTLNVGPGGGVNYAGGSSTILNVNGGTFAHNNGLVVLNSKSWCGGSTYVVKASSSLNFYNLQLSQSGGCGSNTFSTSGIGPFQVQNNLTESTGALNGTWSVGGSWTVNGASGGSAAITLDGSGTQIVSSPSGLFPTGNVTINSLGTVTLGSSVSWNNSSQNTVVQSGIINMAGYNLSLNALTMLGGTIELQGTGSSPGTLTINGSAQGTGTYQSGNITN